MNAPDSESNFPNNQQPETVAIIGVGLIGGSIAAGLKTRNFAGTILGVGRNADRLQDAQARGLIDDYSTEVAFAAKQAEMIVVCTPVPLIVPTVREVAAACESPTWITDAGSTKGMICAELAGGLPPAAHFLGSHPLAGSEKQGFEYADPHLYENRTCVLTPVQKTPPETIARWKSFWEFLGMNLFEMSPELHDQRLAQTSHLPHLLAAALAGILEPEARPLTATGFRDTSRIAAGDPELWVGILRDNSDHLLAEMSRYENQLAHFREVLENDNAEGLRVLLQTAKQHRDALDE